MVELQIPIIINKGRKGLPLPKLARISFELQQFLNLLGIDLEIETGSGWLARDFYEGSFACTVEKIEPVEERKARAFKQAFRNVAKRRPDARIRPSTIRQYTKIADPMDVSELVEFNLPKPETEQEAEWCELTKQQAALIAAEVQSSVRSHGGIQGVIHSVFLGTSPPHFQLRELSTGDLIKCIYNSKKLYDELADALRHRDAVVHVYGVIKTDIANRGIEELRVESIQRAESFSKDDFDRFAGCAPEMLGDQSFQDFIDHVRGRGE